MRNRLDSYAKELTELADKVWGTPEAGFCEVESSKAEVEFLRKHGFEVKTNVADTFTGYEASWGKGKPVIAFLGEFDALHGMSQVPDVLEPKAQDGMEMGQGCGHHLLGVGAIAAGLAYRDILMEKGCSGTVKIFGCPGEESGSGKAYMARDGIFDGCDVALTWHPELYNMVCTGSTQSCMQVYFRFKGISAHAAGAPHLGRSALDAVELMNVGVNYLREHMESCDRVHYAITNAGGMSPNVVQAEAEVDYFIRSATNPQCKALYERVVKIAQGAALMTETELEVFFDEGLSNTVPNFVLEDVLDTAFRNVAPITYTQEERAYAQRYKDTYSIEATMTGIAVGVKDKKKLKEHMRHTELCDYYVETEHSEYCEMGSTDVGDVSWVIPTATVNTACYSYGAEGHSWQWVAQGKSSVAHKGMLYAGEILAESAKILLENPDKIKAAWEELRERLDGNAYECLIPKEIKPHFYQQNV